MLLIIAFHLQLPYVSFSLSEIKIDISGFNKVWPIFDSFQFCDFRKVFASSNLGSKHFHQVGLTLLFNCGFVCYRVVHSIISERESQGGLLSSNLRDSSFCYML
ncbi:hypothetical protein Hanom_Chr17g01586131 [Helianthus anomalus]